MVFYRKYRPQTISDLDSLSLRQTLYALFTKKDIPHAFLFTGPKGLGKTSTARIIAKVVNCEAPILKNGEIEPCNACDMCVSITKGNNIDVLEIDGASNRGIDEIRDLREKARLAPSRAKKKVYIIDEVHMLTTEAFNALLKTIEEPPSHVLFIFCTTEPQKIPPTILSRCFHISLSLASDEELLRSLKRIAQGEGLQIDEEALKTIAKLANGGFRDAAKIMEEIALMGKDGKITRENVETTYHTVGILLTVNNFLANLSSGETKKNLQLITEDIIAKGVDIRFFIQQILIDLNHRLLEDMGIEKKQNRAVVISLEDLQFLTRSLMEVYTQVKSAVIPSLPLEMLVCTFEKDKKTVQHAETVPVFSSSEKPSLKTLMKKEHAIRVQQILSKDTPKIVSKSADTPAQNTIPQHHDPQKSLMENIIYSIKGYNHSLAAVLRSCTIRSIDDTAITFEAAYKFHKERLTDMKGKSALEKVVKEITGKPLSIKIVLRNETAVKPKTE